MPIFACIRRSRTTSSLEGDEGIPGLRVPCLLAANSTVSIAGWSPEEPTQAGS